jgi:hypothetical protein
MVPKASKARIGKKCPREGAVCVARLAAETTPKSNLGDFPFYPS